MITFSKILKFAVALLLITAATLGAKGETEKLPQIFNGKDLSGWTEPENNVWFTVEDGILKVQSDADKKGATLWTEEEYGSFVMEFEFKLGKGTVDSGIFIHKESEQIQIGQSGSLKRDMTASPYISGKGYPVEAEGVKDLLSLDGWNKMKILVEGKKYTVWLNDKQVMTYESDTASEKGPIGIQLHPGRDMGIEYKDIRLDKID